MASIERQMLREEFSTDPSACFNLPPPHHDPPHPHRYADKVCFPASSLSDSVLIKLDAPARAAPTPARPCVKEKKLREPKTFLDRFSVLNLLKICGKEKSLCKTRRIHADILNTPLISEDVYVVTSLLSAYAKCGAFEEAREVLECFPMRNAVTWNALIAGYTQHKLGHEALKCFQQMQDEGISPDPITFICALKACGVIGSIEAGQEIEDRVRKEGLLHKDISVGTTLVDTYAKCGALEKAQQMFNEIPKHNVVSWTALIAGYASHGYGDEALRCFRQMRDEGFTPNRVTYICVLKACGIAGSLEMGEDIYTQIREQGLLQTDVVLGTALIDMYAKCGMLEKAQEMFQKFGRQNVASWTALIAGYIQHGRSQDALKCFRQMKDKGVSPDPVTYICILKACRNVSLEVGEDIATEVRKQGFLQKDVSLGNTLVDMYAKSGAIAKAQEVFEQLPTKDIVSWNVLISGYAQHGLGNEALEIFKKMQEEKIYPNVVTYICILKACGIVGSLKIGKVIHAEIKERGLLQKDVMLGTTLVDMYAKCGALDTAREVFEQLQVQNVASWTALIAGYAQHGLGAEALKCFRQMQREGFRPDGVTYACILKACGIIGSLEIGEDIDAEVRRKGLLSRDILVGNSLIDMYVKCGMLQKAEETFAKLPVQDVISWTSLMVGHAQLGNANAVLDLFTKMRKQGIAPNLVTFLVLLSACSHAGLLEEGESLFNDMHEQYSLTPNLEHYARMIDLYGRAGHFDKAQDLLDKVAPSGNLPLFLGILATCLKWVNVKLGRWAFEQCIQLDEKCTAAYVSMEKLYAMAGMQTEANEIESQRVKSKAPKIAGCCWWTDVARNVHSFVGDDESHPRITDITAKLSIIQRKLSQMGYSPSLHWPLQACSDYVKENILCGQSEKLAVACGLVYTPNGTSLRVTKNMKICGSCHSAISLMSIIENRKIQVNTANCVHIFDDGRCHCEEHYLI